MSTNGANLPARTEQALALSPATARAAAQVEAEIKAGYSMAIARPRNIDQARAVVLRTCRSPAFAADKSTVYLKPVGGGATVEGAGIRLAEELARAWGNMRITSQVVRDDDELREILISGTDMETNFTTTQSTVIGKVIERRQVRKGQRVVGQRETSQGDTVYRVIPTDEEMLILTNSALSRTWRNVVLRLVPQDIVNEATAAIRETRMVQDAQDPKAAQKSVADAFATLNILPEDLVGYLGCPLSQLTPSALSDLRALYGALRDGETTWADVVGAKAEASDAQQAAPERGKLDLRRFKAGPPDPEEPRGGGTLETPGPSEPPAEPPAAKATSKKRAKPKAKPKATSKPKAEPAAPPPAQAPPVPDAPLQELIDAQRDDGVEPHSPEALFGQEGHNEAAEEDVAPAEPTPPVAPAAGAGPAVARTYAPPAERIPKMLAAFQEEAGLTKADLEDLAGPLEAADTDTLDTLAGAFATMTRAVRREGAEESMADLQARRRTWWEKQRAEAAE